jgi:subtilase family serine protease
LDYQLSGGIAPGAGIWYYAAGDTTFQSGLFLAIYRAIDDNKVDIISVSYGECEAALGAAGNQQVLNAWQQAAAQGIAVTVATGDSGSAGCDNPNLVTSAAQGLGINGLASTPYNIALGGTDFDILATRFSTYVNATNSVNYTSAAGYIPEEPWNDSTSVNGTLASNKPLKDGKGNTSIWAGGGGPSTAGNGTGAYSKPAWQQGFVPSDYEIVRDIPDVSLLAGSGTYHAMWAVCLGNDCMDGANSSIHGIGGTSAAAPAFAGVLAMVQQKIGTEIDNLLWRIAECHEIAGMNQHVPIRHAQFGVLAVCIADAYNSHRGHRLNSLCRRLTMPALVSSSVRGSECPLTHPHSGLLSTW